MTPTLVLGLVLTSTIAPSNLVLAPCEANGLVLRIEAESLGEATRAELVNQLGIGLVSRGYALCTAAEPTNLIAIDQLDDGSLDILARYHGRQARRVLEPAEHAGKAAGLTLAVAVEELVLVVADPRQASDRTMPQAPPPSPAAAPSRPWLRLGVEAQGFAYQATRLGFGVAVRADRELLDWLRLGVAIAARQIDSRAKTEGSVRYRVLEIQASALGVVLRGDRAAVALGVGVAPALAQGVGQPSEGFAGDTTTRGILTARALVDLEARLTHGQTVALRFGGGRPIRALSARTEAGRPLGGLAEWELSLGASWLWSFY